MLRVCTFKTLTAISSTEALSFNSSREFQKPSDLDADNVYEIFVNATHGSSTGFVPVRVTVTRSEGL